MLFSENRMPELSEFQRLMRRTDIVLNDDATRRPKYYKSRGGNPLEDDVKEALEESAKGTPFEGTIVKVSGQRFPDIIAARYYGVEVKSTKDDHWKSTGSSILESTRDLNVERIYMTFGKLGGHVEFLSKPYEECLYGIAVTHMPRYLIDMKLNKNETIFTKIGIEYDTLRKMENPIAPVSSYYRSQLNPGESLWWAGEADTEEKTAPAVLRLWTSLSPQEKRFYTAQAYALFPEIMAVGSPTKYQRYALWLVTEQSIVNTNIRDQFSAGGQVTIITSAGIYENIPQAFGKIKDTYKDKIKEIILNTDEKTLLDLWKVSRLENDRINQWCKLVAIYSSDKIRYKETYTMLSSIFEEE